MKKRFLLLAAVTLVFVFLFTGCSVFEKFGEDKGDGGQQSAITAELELKDITLEVGGKAQLVKSININGESIPISYTASSSDIKIENGVITALAADTETLVTASAEGMVSKSFKVFVNGEQSTDISVNISLNDIILAEGSSVALVKSVRIGDADYDLEYSYSGDAIVIENGTLTANTANTKTIVTASAENFTGKFSVVVERIEIEEDEDMSDIHIAFGDVELELWQSMPLLASVVVDGSQKPISYSFEGDAVKIENNLITALKYNTVSVITASVDGYTTSFKVTVGGDVGVMTLDAPDSIYTNYAPKKINVYFSNPSFASDVVYTTSNSKVFVENGEIFAKGDFSSETTVTVSAKSKYHTASFSIKVSKFNKHSAESKVQWYEDNVIKSENLGGTIFIGDSYFDGYCGGSTGKPPFWSDFYDDYADEKAFLMGISSSQIDTWEIVSERVVYPMQPKEIVIHIGFNDAHSSTNGAYEIASRIIALIDEFHERMPETDIYYCSVEPKKNALTSPNYNYTSMVKATAINAIMSDYADNSDFMTFVNTRALCFNEDGSINQSFYLSIDLSHPTLEAYDSYRETIKSAMSQINKNGALIQLEANQAQINAEAAVAKADGLDFSITNLDGAQEIVNSGKTFTSSDGKNLTSYYSVSGYMDIKALDKTQKSHIQFRVSKTPSDARLLLWDTNQDGSLGICYINKYAGEDVQETVDNPYSNAFSVNGSTVTLKWQVIVTTDTAYFYINDVLVEKFEGITGDYFNIGTKYVNADVYGVKLVEKAQSESAYNAILAEKKIV